MYSLLHTFSGLTVAFAGIAFGMCALITILYWRVYKAAHNGKRLLPLHVMGISISYSMICIVAVARLGDPPPYSHFGQWWIYPFITLAFMIGVVALSLILKFIHDRGSRYPKPNKDDFTHGTDGARPAN